MEALPLRPNGLLAAGADSRGLLAAAPAAVVALLRYGVLCESALWSAAAKGSCSSVKAADMSQQSQAQ